MIRIKKADRENVKHVRKMSVVLYSWGMEFGKNTVRDNIACIT